MGFITEETMRKQQFAPLAACESSSVHVEEFKNSKRILLVEDDDDTADAICRLLQGIGYDVKVAGSIASASKIAAESSLDLVISDIGLPDGTGLELMCQLRDRHGLKGICLSGFDSSQDIELSKTAGFVAHLVKPFNIEKLESLIKQFMP